MTSGTLLWGRRLWGTMSGISIESFIPSRVLSMQHAAFTGCSTETAQSGLPPWISGRFHLKSACPVPCPSERRRCVSCSAAHSSSALGAALTHHADLLSPQANILQMMEDNKQLALRIDGAIQSASQEVTNLRSELTATNRRLAELNSADPCVMENNQHNTQGKDPDGCSPPCSA